MKTTTNKKPRKPRADKGEKRGPQKPKAESLAAIIDSMPVNMPVIVTAINPEFKLVDNCPRSPLIEGRNYGIGYALCKRTGDTVETVGPISPCKDYVNDQVYSEWTGKPFGAWGYKAKKEGIFEGHDFGYIAMGIFNYKHGGRYDTQDKDEKNMAANYEAIAKFVNEIEELLKLPLRTTIRQTDKPDRWVAVVPMFWCRYTYLISLLTLLIRVALESGWNAEKTGAMEALKKCKTGDGTMVMSALPKLEEMIVGNIPVQDFTTNTFWHDEGIVSYAFPK